MFTFFKSLFPATNHVFLNLSQISFFLFTLQQLARKIALLDFQLKLKSNLEYLIKYKHCKCKQRDQNYWPHSIPIFSTIQQRNSRLVNGCILRYLRYCNQCKRPRFPIQQVLPWFFPWKFLFPGSKHETRNLLEFWISAVPCYFYSPLTVKK